MAEDDDGFTEVTDKNKFIPVWRRDAKTYVFRSEVFTQYAADKWNVYFETITGKNIDFKFSPRTLPYASALECRRNLDVLLIPLMPERPIIWDLTAGSGSDLVAFGLWFNCAKYFGVDFMVKQDFELLLGNARKFTKAYPYDYPEGCVCVPGEGRDIWNDPKRKIFLQNTTAKKFIQQYGHYVKTELEYNLVHCVYVDPSWSGDYLAKNLTDAEYMEKVRQDVNDGEALPASIEHEASPDILMDWVAREILTPMAQAKPPIRCAVLVLKVRFELTSVKMQTYLDNHPEIGRRFVVLYAVQALPHTLHEDMGKENGHIVIMDTIHGKKVKRHTVNKYGVNIVKGQFHFLVLKDSDFTYVNDSKADWYDKEVLVHEPKAVYVLDSSTMKRTFKPTYSDKLPSVDVLTEKQWMQKNLQEQELYRKVEPVRKMSDVQELDMSTYVEMLGNLERELTAAASENKYNIPKIVERIKNVLRLTSNYEQKHFDDFKSASTLRNISKHMKAIVEKYKEEIKEPAKNTGNTEAVSSITDRRRGRMKGEFRTDLDTLLQQLRGLVAV